MLSHQDKMNGFSMEAIMRLEKMSRDNEDID